ncbi:MAG: hypothetical protein ACR2JV_09215 [Gaiellales bacterium]
MSGERPRFCPFCGEPVGSFFGHHGTDDTVWCDRCQEWFRAERVDEPGEAPGLGVDTEE